MTKRAKVQCCGGEHAIVLTDDFLVEFPDHPRAWELDDFDAQRVLEALGSGETPSIGGCELVAFLIRERVYAESAQGFQVKALSRSAREILAALRGRRIARELKKRLRAS